MNNPKFKKGDVVYRNSNKPTASFESIKYYNRLGIKRVEKLRMVYYYEVDKPHQFNDNILFPQVDFDSMYDLDILYSRKLKIEKIHGRIKTTKI